MADDLDDLLGPDGDETAPSEEPNKKKTRPAGRKKPGPKPGSRNHMKAPQSDKRTPDAPKRQVDILGGVTTNFLSQVFRMKAATVRRRLGECEVRRYEGSSPIYDLHIAAQYLVKPQIDLREFFRTLRPDELPSLLQKDVWDAELKKQKWTIEAGELWYTEDVLEATGEVFKTIKNTAQLWQDNIDHIEHLTDKQREALSNAVHGLLNDLYTKIVEQQFSGEISNQAEQVDDNGLPVPRKSESE